MCRVQWFSLVIKMLKLVWINTPSSKCEYVPEAHWMSNKLIFGRFVRKMDKSLKVIFLKFLKLGTRDAEWQTMQLVRINDIIG